VAGRLTGKVAFVTGAGTGIGRAVAVRFAEEGAEVIVTSRSLAHAAETAALVEKATGNTPLAFAVDVTDPLAINAALEAAGERFGKVHIVSNNAGVDDPSEPSVVDTSDEVWETTFRVNVTGAFFLSRVAVPLMADGGAIVHTGSANSIAPRVNAAAYCASKAALLMFTRSLALELAPRRIRVNCVCPGVVDTPLTDLFLNQSDDPVSLRAAYAESNPLRRIADAREIANAVVFLASDESSFMTGAPLIVDGGGLAGGG
jgi:NAD(P)-dependent dehydrogenase (short-subunit alcohol dehydrogenase family)